ncbi:MAG: hypothetical protein Q9169_008077, partial [Polycauliona sp. 2 TL-2023]
YHNFHHSISDEVGKSHRRERCDPPLLSVNKQLYKECSEILYRCNFVIDVNCGMGKAAVEEYDQLWRGTNLTGRFPFEKAQQITLFIFPHPFSGPDHLFLHMLYMCGLLSSEVSSIKKLQIHIVGYSYFDLGRDCHSWKDTGKTGVTEGLDFVCSDHPSANSIAFYLTPLGMLRNVKTCEITWDDSCSREEAITPETEKLCERYKKAVTGEEPFEQAETKWLREEYRAMLDRQEQSRMKQIRNGYDDHTTWLLNAHRKFKCAHRGHGHRYHLMYNKKVKCEGCKGQVSWLVDCLHCSLRACARCTNELKEKRSDMEDIVRWQEWKRKA